MTSLGVLNKSPIGFQQAHSQRRDIQRGNSRQIMSRTFYRYINYLKLYQFTILLNFDNATGYIRSLKRTRDGSSLVTYFLFTKLKYPGAHGRIYWGGGVYGCLTPPRTSLTPLIKCSTTPKFRFTPPILCEIL